MEVGHTRPARLGPCTASGSRCLPAAGGNTGAQQRVDVNSDFLRPFKLAARLHTVVSSQVTSPKC